jgi:hypothetical protein
MNPATAFGNLPANLRLELLKAYNKITTNYRENRWEPSELNGGKLCEIIYSILDGYTSGTYPARSSKPANMAVSCQQLANRTGYPYSVRIHIPRLITTLYDVRNHRGVGHVGGEVDPNLMDATLVLGLSKWLMAELVRIFHNVDTATAEDVVAALTERQVPLIWTIDGKKRVLNHELSMKNKTLLILYSSVGGVTEKDLLNWTEHTNASTYRNSVLVPGHKVRLWEYDKSTKTITISPLGIKEVESELL